VLTNTAWDPSMVELFERWRRRPSSSPSLDGTVPEPSQSDLAPDEPQDEKQLDPVSQVLRKTDVWFAYRIDDAEKQARELAATHAAVGQPRHDLTHTAPLPMEVLLAQRGTELLQNWADRVRVRMQGAMEQAVEELGAAVSDAREAMANATVERNTLAKKRATLELERAAAVPRVPARAVETIEVQGHLSPWAAWPLLALLVLADFFANLPIFVELLPTDAQTTMALNAWGSQQLSENGLVASYGIHRLGQSVATHPEPAILAVSVIVFFLLLGDQLGVYLRRLVALWDVSNESGSIDIVNRRRQSILPVLLTMGGVALTIAFLYGARGAVHPLAQERLEASETKLASVQADIGERTRAGEEISPNLFSRQAAAETELTYRRDRLDYASTLSAVNRSVLLLNVVLVVAATLIGYAHLSETIALDPTPSLDERLSGLQREVDTLSAGFAEKRRSAYDALRRAHRVDTRIAHLSRIDILRDLDAKTARVSCLIPLFRSENARLRSLDVSDIQAFRTPPSVHFPSAAELLLRVEMPPEVERLRADVIALNRSVAALDWGGDPDGGVGARALHSVHNTA
jgi:hypothetical protein